MILFRNKKAKSPISLIGDKSVDQYFIKSLKKSRYDTSEQSLLKCIEDNKSKNLVYCAVIALRAHGTAKSIPALKKLTSYPMADVKVCSVLAIGAIAKEKETPFYAELLNSKFKDKGYVMSVIWEVGDERAYQAVLQLAKKILDGRIKIRRKDESLYIAEYIERFATSEQDKSLAKSIRELGKKIH